MEFEWNENKRKQNLEKHGIDFEDAIGVFEGHYFDQRSDRNDEKRWIAVGEVNERILAVVYTRRGSRYRIISARRARTDEEKLYYRSLPLGPPEGGN